ERELLKPDPEIEQHPALVEDEYGRVPPETLRRLRTCLHEGHACVSSKSVLSVLQLLPGLLVVEHDELVKGRTAELHADGELDESRVADHAIFHEHFAQAVGATEHQRRTADGG